MRRILCHGVAGSWTASHVRAGSISGIEPDPAGSRCQLNVGRDSSGTDGNRHTRGMERGNDALEFFILGPPDAGAQSRLRTTLGGSRSLIEEGGQHVDERLAL